MYLEPLDWSFVTPTSNFVVDAAPKSLGKPILQTRPGVPVTIEIGSQTGVMVRSVVTVDASGRTVNYRTEVLKAGAIQSAHSGTALVQDEV